jgi:ABC-2 type transport system ATP-binding protein
MSEPESDSGLIGPSSPVGESVLEVRGARRSFGEREALCGVDLDLVPGSIYGLLGPNGAGKTTLLRSICGRLALDSGTVRLSGDDPVGNPEVRRSLGFVPQEIALYPDLTARENLEIFGGLTGLSRSEAREIAGRLLTRIQLAQRAGDPVHTLSGGMKRRLNIAAGVVHRPSVLLLDEPTVGVDPSAREGLHDLLRELRDEGLAILLTTHDLDQAAELADVIGVLIDGRIHAQGSLDELLRQVFDGGKEVVVTLGAEPSAAARSRLLEDGFEPARVGDVWTGRLRGTLSDLSAIGRQLEEAGLPVAEVRVREPSLRGVFFHFAGRDIDR